MNDLFAIACFLACLFACFYAGLRHERRKHKDAILWARSAAYAEGRKQGHREAEKVKP